jgi:4'-phosphopantetheinyl transferase
MAEKCSCIFGILAIHRGQICKYRDRQDAECGRTPEPASLPMPMKPIDSCAAVELSTLSVLLTEMPPIDLWLSESEQRRLASMTSSPRRQQFLAGHWLLRRLAAEVHGEEPSQWSLMAGPNRAPLLQSKLRSDDPAIHASLSHSGDSLAAVVAHFPVGIDLERPGKQRNLPALADRVFSLEENDALLGLPENERAMAFYLYWTIKESVGKRDGHGLQSQLSRRQKPLPCAAVDAEVRSWQFADCSLSVAGGIGMSVRVASIPDKAIQHYWRIESI